MEGEIVPIPNLEGIVEFKESAEHIRLVPTAFFFKYPLRNVLTPGRSRGRISNM